MLESIQTIEKELSLFQPETKEEIEAFRLKYLSRKGIIPSLFDDLKLMPKESKKEIGMPLNNLKRHAESILKEWEPRFSDSDTQSQNSIDLTLPPVLDTLGSLHPLTLIQYRIIEIFEKLGFGVADGPEIENDWHNFAALNFPLNHPARDMQDTFFVSQDMDMVLRTHTSNVQIRLMETQNPPLRAIMPGRVYRNEVISARANCFFHQVEGIYIDHEVSFADLKQTLYHFVKEMFGEDTKIRFRPSFFPFTEPSSEIDISCLICHGKKCTVCKHSGWVEIAGSGMVHPNVLKNVGIDTEEFTGFAFGMGVERIAMLKYGIDDLRMFAQNDIRFLKQFKVVL